VPIRITGGANRVQVARPAGVPVRLRVDGGLGKAELDGRNHGGSSAETIFETDGARSAKDLFEIEVLGGLAGIRVSETVEG
jgi:hypothetical protein